MAVMAEELGFLGLIIVFTLYFLLLYRLFSSAWVSADRAGVYLAFLAAMLIGCQFLINVMMLVGLFPITGIPVPLLSYGGSSLLTSFLVCGLAINVRMRRFSFI
jgi:rod shape determining protein RodA